MTKNNVYESFLQALLFSGTVSIPRFLLNHYSYLGLTDREMMLIIHFLSELSDSHNQEYIEEEITRKMGISTLEYNSIIQKLQDKGFLAINLPKNAKRNFKPMYDFGGLIDQCFELWGINQFKQLEASDFKEPKKKAPGKAADKSLTTLITTFEQELGRPLTGFECEHIEKWLLASYSEELITEALRRGVSAGIRSFRYLDSILREWEKKGLKTRTEVEEEDENFQARQGKKSEKQAKISKTKKNKYDDIYL